MPAKEKISARDYLRSAMLPYKDFYKKNPKKEKGISLLVKCAWQGLLRDANDLLDTLPNKSVWIWDKEKKIGIPTYKWLPYLRIRIPDEWKVPIDGANRKQLAKRLRKKKNTFLTDEDTIRAMITLADSKERNKVIKKLENLIQIDERHKLFALGVALFGNAIPAATTLLVPAGIWRGISYGIVKYFYITQVSVPVVENFGNIAEHCNDKILPVLNKLNKNSDDKLQGSFNEEAKNRLASIVWGIGTDLGMISAFLIASNLAAVAGVFLAGRYLKIRETYVEAKPPKKNSRKKNNRHAKYSDTFMAVQNLRNVVESGIMSFSGTGGSLLETSIVLLTTGSQALQSRLTLSNRQLAAVDINQLNTAKVNIYLADLLEKQD